MSQSLGRTMSPCQDRSMSPPWVGPCPSYRVEAVFLSKKVVIPWKGKRSVWGLTLVWSWNEKKRDVVTGASFTWSSSDFLIDQEILIIFLWSRSRPRKYSELCLIEFSSHLIQLQAVICALHMYIINNYFTAYLLQLLRIHGVHIQATCINCKTKSICKTCWKVSCSEAFLRMSI